MANLTRNLEHEVVYVNRWTTGLVSQRSPLSVPMTAMGLQIVAMRDALYDGLNCEMSPTMTVQRRPGLTRFCSQQLGGAEYPIGWYGFENLSGTLFPILDTNSRVATFSSSAITSVLTKTSTNPMSFRAVGSTLYMCDGNDADTKKWDGSTTTKWGVTAPALAPTITIQVGALSPLSGYSWGYCYKNSTSGHLSTMSPASANTAKQTSKSFGLSGPRSTDTQVDKIEIYRIMDGGSRYYFVAQISNPPAGNWSYTDTLTDSQLNDFLIAPTAHLNDPPPAGIGLVVMHMGRLWVTTGNYIYFSSGSDVTNGVPEESFAPANVLKLPGVIKAMASLSIGLVVWTVDNAYLIGVSSLGTYAAQLWQANFGVTSQKCVAQDGDTLFILTSRGQLFGLSNGLEEIGQPIRKKLSAMNPATVSIALHRSGEDEGLFVCDGSTTIYRYSIATNNWSTAAVPVGGVGVVGSIETSLAQYRLMIGRPTGAGYLLTRDTTTFVDDGSAYPAWVIVGSMVMASPGQTALIESVMLETMPVGNYPTVSVLLNEISGQFTALPNPVPDPPMLPASTTVITKRHYLKTAQTPLPQHVRHMQVKIDFASQTQKSELLGLAIG